MADVEIQVKGLDETAGTLEGLGDRAADAFRALTPQVRDVFRAGEQRRFDTSGPGWAPLAASTLERKARQNLPPAILRATGALYQSLTRDPTADAVSGGLRLGTGVFYAQFHQAGTGTMPRRELVAVSDRDAQAIADLVGEYITGRP